MFYIIQETKMFTLKLVLTAFVVLFSLVLLKKALKKKCKKKKNENLNPEKTTHDDEHEVGKI